MNITDAAHKTVKDYPGGSESLGPRISMSPAVLRNKVNPNNGTHHLSLAEANEILGVTGDHRILHAMAAEHGYVLQRVQSDSTSSVMGLVLENAAREGAFAQTLQEALSDGLITENEMAALSRAGFAQMEGMTLLLARLRDATGVRGVTP